MTALTFLLFLVGLRLYDDDNLLSREEALRLYTIGSAWFSNEEDVKGRIKAGQLADFIVLLEDYFSVSDDQVKQIESVLTVVNGEIVYGGGSYANLAPELPPILPEWSPMKRYPSYWKAN